MTNDSPVSRRNRWLALLLVMLVFISGAIVGAGLLRWLGRPMGPPPPGTLGPPLSDIGLTADQEQKALAVIERHRPEIEGVLRDVLPHVREIQERVEAEVRTFLTPEQAQNLDRFKASHLPPPAFPGPPPPPPGPAGHPAGP